MRCDEEPGSGACGTLQQERIRYFTGRHMTARDFRDGDAYHRSHRHLHNRILHGSGVACGLDVRMHWNPECRSDRVIVRCGMAIDCCGREIVVPRDVVSDRMPWGARPEVELEGKSRPDRRYVLVLCLLYKESRAEKVPVLYSPEACSSPEMEDGRIREEYSLCWRWVRKDQLGKYGWRVPGGCPPPRDPESEGDDSKQEEGYRRKDDPEQRDRPDPCPDEEPPRGPDERCCLDPDCPPDHCLPIAVIVAWDRQHMDGQRDIDTTGRPALDAARDQLTTICWISWKHGGVVPVRDLNRLRIRFSRPLGRPSDKEPCGPRGVNACTFQVTYGGGDNLEDLDFVAYDRPPYLDADGRTAVYELDQRRGFRNLIGLVVHVTLKCDFLADCDGKPVDGNHLGGRLPTGDGVAGGTFESWFRVVSDREYPPEGEEFAADAQHNVEAT